LKRFRRLVLSIGCLLLGLGIYNSALNLVSAPPVRVSIPYVVAGILIMVISLVRRVG
jgi:hypothetical protein